MRRLRVVASLASVLFLCACDSAQETRSTAPAPQPQPPQVWSLSRDVSELLVELGVASSVIGADRESLALRELADAVDLGLAGSDCLALPPSHRPELAIGVGSPAGRELAAQLESRGIPTLLLEPRSANEVLEAIHRLGALMRRETRAAAVAAQLARDVAAIAVRRDGRTRRVAVWLVERDPARVVGATGFLHELLELAGAENAVHTESGDRVELGAGLRLEPLPEIWLDSTGGSLDASAPPGLVGIHRESVPEELARLPVLDLPRRVAHLHALLYPQGT